jgi:hypothetical protein
MDPRRLHHAIGLVLAAWTALSSPAIGAAMAPPRNVEAAVGDRVWAWEANGYLGFWTSSLAWPELARCWQRYGGDASVVAPAPPPEHAARAVPLWVFPRHADFDRATRRARRPGPYPEQAAALELLARQGPAIADSVLDSVHAFFLDQQLDSVLEEVFTREGEENLGRLKQRETIGETVELKAVHVHNKWKDGVAYVGLRFETHWDDGHGLGVLLHGTRIVQVGGSDAAFNPSQWADGELEEPRQPWLR